MADYVFIWGAANESEWVIDIQGASPASGTLLCAFPQKPNCNDNQQWEVAQSTEKNPSGSGDTYYYFIKSRLNKKNVITAIGNSVQVSEQKSHDSEDQLWWFGPQNGPWSQSGESYFPIHSAKGGNSITIPDGTKKSNALLQLSAFNNNLNQLWIFGGLGAPGVQATH